MGKEYYKKRLIDLRAAIVNEKEAKKRDNTYYASMIKNTKSVSNKASYRKLKIDRAATHDRTIERLKREVELTREAMRRAR